MSRLQDLRDTLADELVAEGDAIQADDLDLAIAKWGEAYDVRRGHADRLEWLP